MGQYRSWKKCSISNQEPFAIYFSHKTYMKTPLWELETGSRQVHLKSPPGSLAFLEHYPRKLLLGHCVSQTGLAGCFSKKSSLNSGSEIPFLLKNFISKIFHVVYEGKRPTYKRSSWPPTACKQLVLSRSMVIFNTASGPRETSRYSNNFNFINRQCDIFT